MSRGSGRGGRGWRGVGRGGFGGASNLPPMGLSFADIQNLSREASSLYPVCVDNPFLPNRLIVRLHSHCVSQYSQSLRMTKSA
jgi:hypothetical protein